MIILQRCATNFVIANDQNTNKKIFFWGLTNQIHEKNQQNRYHTSGSI